MPAFSKATTLLPVHEAERTEGNCFMKYSPDFILQQRLQYEDSYFCVKLTRLKQVDRLQTNN